MDNKELYRIFERQRRNLILMSVLLFGIIVTGITIKELNFVFVKLNNPNHEHLLLFLWVIFCYFIIRYNQYLKAVGLSKMEAEIIKVFDNMITKEIGEKSNALTLNDFKTSKDKNNFDNFEKSQTLTRNILVNKNIRVFEIMLSIVGHKDDGETDVLTQLKIQPIVDYRKHKAKRLYSWIIVSFKNFDYFEFFFPNVLALFVCYKAIPELLKMLH